MFKIMIALLVANFALSIGSIWLQLWGQNNLQRNLASTNNQLLKRMDDVDENARIAIAEGSSQDKSVINSSRLRQLLALEKEAKDNLNNCKVELPSLKGNTKP